MKQLPESFQDMFNDPKPERVVVIPVRHLVLFALLVVAVVIARLL